ncbi:MAG: class I SAM-dependent methyltransferase [Candidatus Bathyarchaeota archaeon]|nr:MAG: class I SAM-dependent methyltransferase [Candidatus Bathyarchaeota archaeon]
MVRIQSYWEEYYSTLKRLPRRLKSLAQFVIDALPAFKQSSVETVLDLGCGTGRHSIFLAKEGFRTIGIEVSKSALRLARKWAQREKLLNVDLLRASMTNIPFRDCCFGAVVGVSVIHHAVIEDIEATVGEIYRILNQNGYFLANVASVEDPRYGIGQKVEDSTFRISEAFEEKRFEELHHFFTKTEVSRLLSNFAKTNVKLMKGKPNYWELSATK